MDHLATQRVKRAALLRHGGLPANLELEPVNLADPTVIPATTSRTFFVAEGLLMYLPPKAVEAVFRATAPSAPSAQFAFTFLEPRASDGSIGFARKSAMIDAWLRRPKRAVPVGDSPR